MEVHRTAGGAVKRRRWVAVAEGDLLVTFREEVATGIDRARFPGIVAAGSTRVREIGKP